MILTARAMDCPYIWHAHGARARQQGISDVRGCPADHAVAGLARRRADRGQLRAGAVHDAPNESSDVSATLTQFGARGVTELTTLMGYYTLLAFNANTFEIDVPAGGPEPKLPI